MNNKHRGFWTALSYNLGAMICMPAIMIGHIFYQKSGIIGAIGAMIIGYLGLFILSLLPIEMGIRSRSGINAIGANYLTPYLHKIVCAVFIIISMSWFGVQLGVMALAAREFFANFFDINQVYFALIIGILIVWMVHRGVAAISLFADFMTPVMLVVIVLAVSAAYNAHSEPIIWQSGKIATIDVFSIIASCLSGVMNMPNYLQFAKNERDAKLASFITYVVGAVLVGSVGAFLAILNPESDLVAALVKNKGCMWQFWAAFFVVIAGWTTSNANLYDAGLALKQILPSIKKNYSVLIAGFFGVVLGALRLNEHFVIFLQFIGFMIGPFAVVLMVNFFQDGRKVLESSIVRKQLNSMAVICGSAFGWCAFFKIMPSSGVPIFDACAISLMVLITCNVSFAFKKLPL